MARTLRNCLFVGLCFALSLADAALAGEDYSTYRVLDTKVIEGMWVPAGQTAALLSPDGSRLLHLGRRDPGICLLAPAQMGPWVKLACAEYTDDNRPGEAQDMLWSPAGDELLMPTYHDGYLRSRDTDIRIFDAATFTVRNLTDDGFDGSLSKADEGPAELDVLARWSDDNSIFFIRHSIPEGGRKQGVTTSLMTIETDGSEPQPLIELATGGIRVWNFAVSLESRLLAYSVDGPKDADDLGVYLLSFGDKEPTRIASMSDLGGMRLDGMAFSADPKYLLLLGRKQGDDGLDALVLDIATGEIIAVDAGQKVVGVAWSPTGSALAYITYDRTKRDAPGGLFLSPAPGKPARLLIGGGFFPTVCCGELPIIWATNDTMVLSRLDDELGSVLYVQLGQ